MGSLQRGMRRLGVLTVLMLSAAGVSLAQTAPANSTAKPATTSKAATSPAKSASASKTPAKPPTPLGAPVKSYGSSTAPITMEVFSDYECPVCRNLYEGTLRQLITDYVASGKVYLVHRDFPLPGHKYGYEAARWLNASARIGKFADAEAALYDNQNSWAQDGNIGRYIASAMSPADFKRVEANMHGCSFDAPSGMKSASFAVDQSRGEACAVDSFIEADRALGNKIPVSATPTWVFYYKGNRLPVGTGVVPWPILKQYFDALLSQ